MASFVGGSLRAGAKIRNSQGSDIALSKVVELNGRYRLFFPVRVEVNPVLDEDGNPVLDETGNPVEEKFGNIPAAVVPGRPGDYEVIGTSFIPYTAAMYKIDPITQQATDTTPLEDWARIARVLYEANCVKEKQAAEEDAKKTADAFGKPIDQVALQKALDAIELNYHGGKAANGTDVMPSKSPAIRDGNLTFKISTRVAVVKLDPQNNPDWKSAKYCVYEISRARQDELLALLDNPMYFDMNSTYLEVGYDYIGGDKKEAGKNAKLQGIAKSLSLEVMFAASWKAQGKNFIANIVKGSEQEQVDFLRSRNRAFKSGKTPQEVISAFRDWCSTNQSVFIYIDFENEAVTRSAKLFLESHLVDGMNRIKDKFVEAAANAGKDSAASTATSEDTETTAENATLQQMVASASEQEETTVPEVSAEQTAKAVEVFGSGSADAQNLRTIADMAAGLDIADADLGDI